MGGSSASLSAVPERFFNRRSKLCQRPLKVSERQSQLGNLLTRELDHEPVLVVRVVP